MNEYITFDQLWNACEKYFSQTEKNDNVQSVIEQLILNCNVYKLIDKNDFPIEEKNKMKAQTLGEILFTITNISLLDDINVFTELHQTLIRKQS